MAHCEVLLLEGISRAEESVGRRQHQQQQQREWQRADKRANIKEVSDGCKQAMMMANTALRYNQQVATTTNALGLEWI